MEHSDAPCGIWQGFSDDPYPFPFATASPGGRGIDAGDYDNDGDMDLYITEDSVPGQGGNNDLLYNKLLGGFATSPVSPSMTAGFSWGTRWFDANNDGVLDLYVAGEKGWNDWLFIQNPITKGFTNQAQSLGVVQDNYSRGVLTADYDRDGDQDVFVVNLNRHNSQDDDASVLWDNQVSQDLSPPHFLNIKLVGDPSLLPANYRSCRDALGAKVHVTANVGGLGPVTGTREVRSGSGNGASTSSLSLGFGLGQAESAEVSIEWPSGRETELSNVQADQFLRVYEGLPILDIFSSESPNLDGRLSEEGGPTWSASNLKVVQGKALPQGLPFPIGYQSLAEVPIAPTPGRVSSVLLDTTMRLDAGTTGWIFLGFSSTALTPMETGNKKLFAGMAGNDRWKIVQNGTHLLAGGNAYNLADHLTGWVPGTSTHLRIEYRIDQRTVSLYAAIPPAGLQPIAENVPILAASTPELRFAGFQARRPDPNAYPPQTLPPTAFDADDFKFFAFE